MSERIHAVRSHPTQAAGWEQLARVLCDAGHVRMATAACLRAIGLDGSDPRLWWMLACLHEHAAHPDAAAQAGMEARSLNPPAGLSLKLAALLSRLGCFHAAAQARAQALAAGEVTAALLTELGTDLCAAGQVRDGLRVYAAALAHTPGFPPAQANLLFAMHLDESLSPAVIADAHFGWGRQTQSAILPAFDFQHWNRDADRPLRIAFLASDLRNHSIVHFLAPLLDGLNRAQVHITVIANVTSPDETTEKLRARDLRWIDVAALDSPAIAARIHEERIDILIETGGHTSPKTLRVLACKPAPIQIAYLAYPDTTGLSTVDYLWTDSYTDPLPEATTRYSEQLLPLDPCLVCYRPPECDPGLRPRTDRLFTFGSFAQRQKLTPTVLHVWAGILRRAPHARLLLKARAWRDPVIAGDVSAVFEAQGVDPARIQFCPHAPSTGSHLDLYNEVDVALDTWPYSGITTTCESLWMGVPVIAMPGANQVSRIAGSILQAAGMPQWVACDLDDYARIALEATRHVPERTAIRQRFRESAVMDEQAFARRAEASLRSIWSAFLGR